MKKTIEILTKVTIIAGLIIISVLGTKEITGSAKEVATYGLVDVIEVDATTYAELYKNKTVYKEFETEIECAEAYSEAWWELHEKEEYKKITNVEEINNLEIKIFYNDGETRNLKFDSEVECAETYSNIWYAVFGDSEVMHN